MSPEKRGMVDPSFAFPAAEALGLTDEPDEDDGHGDEEAPHDGLGTIIKNAAAMK